MRAPSRSRRIAKRAGLVVCVVILAMWAASTRVTFGYQFDDFAVGVLYGRVKLLSFDDDWTGWFSETHSFTLGDASARVTSFEWGNVGVAIPLWMLLVLAAIPTALLWYRDRRTAKPGCCRQCGYDLRASKRCCPECGTATVTP